VSTRPNLLIKFLGLPVADKVQLFRIFVVLLFVRIALSGIGYKRLRKLIPPAGDVAPLKISVTLGRRVARLARLVPGASCLTQAIAAQIMLARLGYQSDMRVGVRQDAVAKIHAHAWLLSGGQVILGGGVAEFEAYAPLVDLSPPGL
jgi:hypothetical protein